jgi:hypothetical protein
MYELILFGNLDLDKKISCRLKEKCSRFEVKAQIVDPIIDTLGLNQKQNYRPNYELPKSINSEPIV